MKISKESKETINDFSKAIKDTARKIIDEANSKKPNQEFINGQASKIDVFARNIEIALNGSLQ